MPAAAKLCFAQTSVGKLSSSGSLQGYGYQRSTHKIWDHCSVMFAPRADFALKVSPFSSLCACFVLFCCLMTITEIVDRV